MIFIMSSNSPNSFWLVALAFLSLFVVSLGDNSSFTAMRSLDSIVKDQALNALLRRKTGILYVVSLPSNLSGIEASVLRQRSGYIWFKGAIFSSIQVLPRATSVPFVKRLVFVYQDLGNWSTVYYNVPGHSIVAPVVGLLAYDASDLSSSVAKDVGLKNVAGPLITVTFPDVALPQGQNITMKCAYFGIDGTLQLSDMTSNNVCYSTTMGHFTIVVPSENTSSVTPSVGPPKDNVETRWRVYMLACAGGVVVVLLVCLLGVGISRLARNKKMEALERNADQGETLDSIWVGISKMPSASMTRTSPIIENKSSL